MTEDDKKRLAQLKKMIADKKPLTLDEEAEYYYLLRGKKRDKDSILRDLKIANESHYF